MKTIRCYTCKETNKKKLKFCSNQWNKISDNELHNKIKIWLGTYGILAMKEFIY